MSIIIAILQVRADRTITKDLYRAGESPID